jgi:hypothetical protein
VKLCGKESVREKHRVDAMGASGKGERPYRQV